MTREEWEAAVPVEHRALMLRTCRPDGGSRNGFVWPREGYAEAPDWSPEPVCGGGLHGALRGEGDGYLLDWSVDALWLAIEVDVRHAVHLNGKVKVRCGWVVVAGEQLAVTAAVMAAHPGSVVIGGTATAGYHGTATAGDRGTATAGDRGTATASDGGTATAGYHGTAAAGDGGTATAGDGGTATAGDGGTATAGDGGTATAGDGGTIAIWWWGGRRRLAVGYVGEGGIEPDVAYRCDAAGRLVRAEGGES